MSQALGRERPIPQRPEEDVEMQEADDLEGEEGEAAEEAYQLEEDEMESDEEQDDEEETDYIDQAAIIRGTRASNYLPRDFVQQQQQPFSVPFNYFMGLYTGDGCHRTGTDSLIKFGFRSTFFPYLYQLLISLGVESPILSFHPCRDAISRTYNVGHFGAVTWGYQNALHGSYLFRFGFPSSNILNSIPDLIDTFLPDPEDVELEEERRISFLVFLLGFFVADGTIDWKWSGSPDNITATYQGISITARDRYILEWVEEELLFYGCDAVIGVTGRHRRLHISTSVMNNEALADALEALNLAGVPMDGKLQLLQAFLENGSRVSYHVLAPKDISFFQFLGPSRTEDDRVACLIGQDLFDLNLYSLNSILEFIGFEPLLSTYTFDLTEFVAAIRDMFEQEDLNENQGIFARYYVNCEARVVAGLEIRNKVYRQPFMPCPIEGCPKFFCERGKLNQHLFNRHRNNFICNVDNCLITFNTREEVIAHRLEVHGTEHAFPCTVCDRFFCSRLMWTRHRGTFHPELLPFVCEFPGCGNRYSYARGLNSHIQSVHVSGGRSIACTEVDCTETFNRRGNLYDHLRRVHHIEPPHPFECDRLDCDADFISLQFLRGHQRDTHELIDCGLCIKRCIAFQHLNHHALQIHGDGPYLCPRTNCNQTFEIIYDVTLHCVNDHDQITCGQCDETFANDFRLRTHFLQVHAERFRCDRPNCTRSYPLLSTLREHQNRDHPKIPCPEDDCDEEFTNFQALQTHLDTRHNPDVLVFYCDSPNCRKTFLRGAELRRHQTRDHGYPPVRPGRGVRAPIRGRVARGRRAAQVGRAARARRVARRGGVARRQ